MSELTDLMVYMGFDRDDFEVTQTEDNIRITLGILAPVIDTKHSHGFLNLLENEGFKILFIAGSAKQGKFDIVVKKV